MNALPPTHISGCPHSKIQEIKPKLPHLQILHMQILLYRISLFLSGRWCLISLQNSTQQKQILKNNLFRVSSPTISSKVTFSLELVQYHSHFNYLLSPLYWHWWCLWMFLLSDCEIIKRLFWVLFTTMNLIPGHSGNPDMLVKLSWERLQGPALS